MDNKSFVVDSICERLANHNIFVNQYIQLDILDALRNYRIISEYSESINDLKTRIQHYIMAKGVDGLSKRSLTSYEQRLKLFSAYTQKSVDSITADDIRSYLMYLKDERRLRETTLATDVNILRSFYSWLFVEELIKKNPMMKIKPVKISKKRLRTPLTIEDIERIRNCYKKDRDKALFEFFYSSGCRLSEAINIDVDQIDFNERTVIVTGKGNKQRKVFFSTRTKIFLQEYLINRKGNSKALFISKVMPYERLKGRAIEVDIKRMGEAAKIESTVYPHILRHSFATHALNSGMDINVIQTLLGHEDVNTTRIYASVSSDMVKNEYNKLIF